MELWLTGVILKPKGLKGEVKVQPVTDFPETFLTRKQLYVGTSPESARPLLIRGASLSGGFVTMFFDGIENRDAAELLAGQNLYVEEENAVARPDGKAWIHELVGMKVIDGRGRERGILTDVLRMPAHEVYEVRIEGGRKILLPAIDEFVAEIDIAGQFMVVPRFDEFL